MEHIAAVVAQPHIKECPHTMRCIGQGSTEDLYGVQATRDIERSLATTLPPFTLMARAGLSAAKLASALAPHARRIWVACGPGNNGGDGLVMARHLLERHQLSGHAPEVVVTLCGDPGQLPPDAAHALTLALQAGLQLATEPPPTCDLAVDALLGIGAHRTPAGLLADHLLRLDTVAPVRLNIDLPSGLLADTGQYLGPASWRSGTRRHTLSLLTLKPGLFTADGRDRAGTVWFDHLGATDETPAPPDAVLQVQHRHHTRPHVSHKGSQGDVVVVGGQHMARSGAGMTGAAMLAARAALYAGAGRVYVGLLDDLQTTWDPACPELMLRQADTLRTDRRLLGSATTVAGCGGGQAIYALLPDLLAHSHSLILDADALNALATEAFLVPMVQARHSRECITVLTPHPLEAARLLQTDTSSIMANRLAAARNIADQFRCICVLKGSGTVIAAPEERTHINHSGNPSLATAGTGDVLAGWIGSLVGQRRGIFDSPFEAVVNAVAAHGSAADDWMQRRRSTLTAHRLAEHIGHGPSPD